MASSRDIKRRIDSVRGTRKITRAMELVASARLRRAQEQIESLRPYAKSMQRLMSQAARQSGTLKGLPLLDERPEIENALVLTITGDRGLAGAFNVNVLRAGFQAADALRVEGAGGEEVAVAVAAELADPREALADRHRRLAAEERLAPR